MSSVLLTSDEKITDKTIGGCIKVAFISMLCANFTMYILAVFFQFSRNQRRRLFKLVIWWTINYFERMGRYDL